MEHTEAEIDSVISRQNVAKEGWTTYYVDGTDGNDGNNGLRWESAFKTIQHAVGTAESWAKIYIAALSSSLLTVNGGIGTNTITVADASIFTPGEIIVIKDDFEIEYITIASIAGNTITTATNLTADYLLVDNAVVLKVYFETVVIPAAKDKIQLIGENEENTIIAGYGSGVLTINSTCCITTRLKIISFFPPIGVGSQCIRVSGDFNSFLDLTLDGDNVANAGVVGVGDYNIIDGITSTCDFNVIMLSGSYTKIRNCNIRDRVSGAAIQLIAGSDNHIYNNHVANSIAGITLVIAAGSNNKIYHNNLIGNTTQVQDLSGNPNHFFENFYDDHTVDTNNDGLCDTPYTFTTGTDYSPVSKRNGWLQESLGITSSSSIIIANIFNHVNALLTLTETGATITTDGTEQDLYINNAPSGVYKPLILQLDFTNQTAAETVVVREYYRIKSGGGFIKKDEVTFAGVQSPLLKNVELEPNRFGVQVTIEKTVGVNKAYDWEVLNDV